MNRVLLPLLCVLVALLFVGCGEWSGGSSADFGFITYTEPLVSEKEVDDDTISYTQNNDDGLADYTLIIYDHTDYEDAEAAALSMESYERMPHYSDVKETTVDGVTAIAYTNALDSHSVVYNTDFSVGSEMMTVQLMPYDDQASAEAWEAYESLLDSISINSDHSEDASYDDEDYDDNEYTEPSGTVGQENALQSAKDYLSMGTGFSEKSLRDQLEYEGYEEEDIDWALTNVDVDWNEQCELSAKSYMESQSFSASGLRNQLSYEGFTDEQIDAGLKAVGY